MEKLLSKYKAFLPVIPISIVSFLLWRINRNIGEAFAVYTIAFYTASYCVLNIVKAFKDGTEVEPAMVVVAMYFLFAVLNPAINFYLDMPDYFEGNLNVKTSIIVKTYYNRGGYTEVYFDDAYVKFWSESYRDFPDGSTMKIYYLPRSMTGVDVEFVSK